MLVWGTRFFSLEPTYVRAVILASQPYGATVLRDQCVGVCLRICLRRAPVLKALRLLWRVLTGVRIRPTLPKGGPAFSPPGLAPYGRVRGYLAAEPANVPIGPNQEDPLATRSRSSVDSGDALGGFLINLI